MSKSSAQDLLDGLGRLGVELAARSKESLARGDTAMSGACGVVVGFIQDIGPRLEHAFNHGADIGVGAELDQFYAGMRDSIKEGE